MPAGADWIIDISPEGGEAGGTIVAEGSPAAIARVMGSYTGQALPEILTYAHSRKRDD
jgi:excinuclease ABC subunit A